MSWIDLEGAANMRDLGGLPTTDGRSTRAGVLLRSDDLQELTDQDLLTLLPWRISTVVDLRTSDERRSAGPAPLEGTGIDHVHADLAGRGVDPADAVLDETEPGTRLERRYAGYLRDGSAALAAALSTIAHTPRGHRGDCAAGKDRTGVVCAVALLVVGVEPSAVVEDYVRTGERVSALRRRLLRSPTHAGLLAGRTSASLRPDPATMWRFLALLERKHGGPAGLADRLGLDPDVVRRLSHHLVLP